MERLRIAIDAMGGDYAPHEIVKGALDFARRNPGVEVALYGEEAPLRRALASFKPSKHGNVSAVYCGPSVGMGESPVEALRLKADASIPRAVEAVHNGEADAFFSAGNTGVCVAATTLKWRLLPGIRRPGIALPFPTLDGFVLTIDMGANVSSKPEHLLGYAVMGSVYAEKLLGVPNPRVALLNVGKEERKGSPLVLEARELLSASRLNFVGYIEGNHLLDGDADVVVCDGFVGNVLLKTAEGVTELILKQIKRAIKRSPITYLAGIATKPAFRKVKKQIHYSNFGGAQLLGVNGVCVIAHGRSDAKAVSNGLKITAEVVRKRVNDMIVAGIERIKLSRSAPQGE